MLPSISSYRTALQIFIPYVLSNSPQSQYLRRPESSPGSRLTPTGLVDPGLSVVRFYQALSIIRLLIAPYLLHTRIKTLIVAEDIKNLTSDLFFQLCILSRCRYSPAVTCLAPAMIHYHHFNAVGITPLIIIPPVHLLHFTQTLALSHLLLAGYGPTQIP